MYLYRSADQRSSVICQTGDIFRVVFGVRDPSQHRNILQTIVETLQASGIRGVLSDNIQRDALQKFSFVSPMAHVVSIVMFLRVLCKQRVKHVNCLSV